MPFALARALLKSSIFLIFSSAIWMMMSPFSKPIFSAFEPAFTSVTRMPVASGARRYLYLALSSIAVTLRPSIAVPFFAAGALDFAFALASFILAVSILPERS